MILYLICGFCMVTCTVSPLSRFTAHLLPVYLIVRIFHFCRNENFRYRYLSFYWKKWFYIWYMAFAWWIVPCLPFPGLPHIYFLFTVRLIIFHVCRNKNFCKISQLLLEEIMLIHFLVMSVETWDIYKFDTNEWGYS
jgi:hypothetical protein